MVMAWGMLEKACHETSDGDPTQTSSGHLVQSTDEQKLLNDRDYHRHLLFLRRDGDPANPYSDEGQRTLPYQMCTMYTDTQIFGCSCECRQEPQVVATKLRFFQEICLDLWHCRPRIRDVALVRSTPLVIMELV